MTTTMDNYTSEFFKKGVEYKVKYEGESRATTRTYEGERPIYNENEKGEIVAGEIVAQFHGRGGVKFYSFDKIVSAVEVDPTKKKVRKPKTCSRCYGAGKFEHVRHVQNGICFKCGGSGVV